MQIRGAGLILLVSLWCSGAMAQPDIHQSWPRCADVSTKKCDCCSFGGNARVHVNF